MSTSREGVRKLVVFGSGLVLSVCLHLSPASPRGSGPLASNIGTESVASAGKAYWSAPSGGSAAAAANSPRQRRIRAEPARMVDDKAGDTILSSPASSRGLKPLRAERRTRFTSAPRTIPTRALWQNRSLRLSRKRQRRRVR